MGNRATRRGYFALVPSPFFLFACLPVPRNGDLRAERRSSDTVAVVRLGCLAVPVVRNRGIAQGKIIPLFECFLRFFFFFSIGRNLNWSMGSTLLPIRDNVLKRYTSISDNVYIAYTIVEGQISS